MDSHKTKAKLEKHTKKSILVWFMALVEKNLKWTYLYKSFQSHILHHPASLPLCIDTLHLDLPRYCEKGCSCRATSCDQIWECDFFGEGFSSQGFHGTLAGMADMHSLNTRRKVWEAFWERHMNTLKHVLLEIHLLLLCFSYLPLLTVVKLI